MRGISTIVAILILIVIIAVAAILVYGWTVGLMAIMGREAQSETKPFSVCLRIVAAQKVWEGVDGVSYEIWLMNCGDSTLHLDYVYVLAPDGTVVHSYYAGDWPVSPGSTEYLWLWIPKSAVESGKRYLVKVVTREGAEAYTTIEVIYSS